MTSTLLDDTGVLLALDIPELQDDLLANVSRTMVMWIALEAKTNAYSGRVTRALATAANEGATLEQLSAAAGLSPDRVRERLATQPKLLTDLSLARLNIPLDRVDPVAELEEAPRPASEPAMAAEPVVVPQAPKPPRRVAEYDVVNRGGFLGWLGFGKRVARA